MKRLLVALGPVLILCAVVRADYIDLPVKWSQVPWDPDAPRVPWSDHLSPGNWIRAEDFQCDDTDPIVAVRWWGGYNNATLRHNGFVAADISFHLSVGDHPTSLPAGQVAFYEVTAQEVWTGQYVLGDFPVYRYDAYLPAEFDQYFYSHDVADREGANIGELFIDICVPTGEPQWFWVPLAEEDPPVAILDWAAQSSGGHDGPWETDPYHHNLAFELMTIPEPATMSLLGLGLAALVARRRSSKAS